MPSTNDFEAIATKAGWVRQENGDWMRPAGNNEPANETTAGGERSISVTSAEEACDWDGLIPNEAA